MKFDFRFGKLLLGILYIGIFVVVFFAFVFFSPSEKTKANIVIDGEKIEVLVADSPELQERGLSGHAPLGSHEGMLFIFPIPNQIGFWMKDMLFPIDIIWIDSAFKIVDVWENAQPSSFPEVRTPKTPAQYVFEVESGFFEKYHLHIGDSLEFTLPTIYTR